MSILNNLSIRYKVLIGFFFIAILPIWFACYLLWTFNQVTTFLSQLDQEADKRTLYATLNTDTKQLSESVKSYILTKNAKWEKVYDTTSVELNNTITESIKDDSNVRDLGELRDAITHVQGTELLILAKTKEGDSSAAVRLFDTAYELQQEHIQAIVTDLVNNQDKKYDKTQGKLTDTLTNAKNVLIVTAVLVVLFTVSFSFIFTALIEYSLKKLTASVRKIAEGDLKTRVAIVSHDEIGQLGASFNSMAEKLNDSYTNLEQKIQEKTKELAVKVTDLEDTKRATLNLLEDIQEEKEIAENKKAQDEAIIGSVGEGLIGLDQSGSIILINPVAEQILEIAAADVVGKPIFDSYHLYDESDAEIIKEKRPVSITLQTGEKISQAYTYIRKDQTKIIISITATPVKQNDVITGVIEVLRDITHEKEVDRMKTEFISLASHQLRTPLSAIKWFSEMLLGGDAGPLTPEQTDFTKNISESTERMVQLVNSLLNISRIESGRIVVDPHPTDLKELVQGVVTDLKAKITERKQNLVISVHGDLPQINLDPRLIRQVYMNLLTNAIKYTPKEGDITVFISKKDDEVISQITDNGYGIPSAQQGRIFQKFFRAQNVAKIETDGTGLGLYLIKAIIESSHGKIWFKSEEGKGTTFWFSLPLSGMEAKKGEVTLDEYHQS
ncbi:MAG TPA: ATP-binding protein [Candidatus Saccharimonadales bacterium]|nr:ATP-binding protein [Candidatus Saccharimonadales bacterium]